MKTLISILGPTAVGKTSFALGLSEQALGLVSDKNSGFAKSVGSAKTFEGAKTGQKKFAGVDLISADSRQVYKGLEVLSGADIPKGFVQVGLGEIKPGKNLVGKTIAGETSQFPVYPYLKNGLINLHGVSILEPTQEWSVAHFKNFAIKIINDSFENNRLPIIVGGTNLYINHLFNLDKNLYVSPISEIREKAESMSLEELQLWLKSVNQEKFASMNHSDISNPRRLVRAIEISLGKPKIDEILNLPKNLKNLKIGLVIDQDPAKNLEKIMQKINQRVIERFQNGAVEEVKKLAQLCGEKDQVGYQEKNQLPNSSVCSTLGISDISSFLKGEIDQEKCLESWALHEFQYAKRQLVWLKKEKELVWLDDLTKSSYTLFNEKISI